MYNILSPILLAITLNVIVISSLKVSKSKCKEQLNIYDNIQCDALYDRGGKGPQKRCPSCYDCTQINPRVNKCYYHGRYYAIGDVIDETIDPVPSCYTSCTCLEDLTFVCAIYDCVWPYIPIGCYATYNLKGCCPVGYNCPNNHTLICHVDGDVAYEGQTFRNPKDPCSNCICTKGVTGDPDDPHCQKYVCDIEISQSNRIQAYCAPVYLDPSDCCPFEYMCPRDDDRFLKTCGDDSYNSSHTDESFSGCPGDGDACKQCRYGKKYYDIGTRFSRLEKFEWYDDYYWDTDCECKTPPYFTCSRNFDPIIT